jgi:N-acetylglutamate synthase
MTGPVEKSAGFLFVEDDMANLDAVRQTEEHLINAWPGLRTMVCNGWVFREARGYTKRANSANAIAARGDFAHTLERARAFYGSLGSPTIFRLTPLAGEEPDHILADLGFESVDETIVMTASIAGDLDTDCDLDISPACSSEWESGYASAHAQDDAQRQSHRAILGAIAPLPMAFASILQNGVPIAVGLGVIERGSLGIFDIVTSPSARRQGAARKLVGGLLHWGRQSGADNAWLSVVADNANAQGLYRQFGFAESYRYHYRMAA